MIHQKFGIGLVDPGPQLAAVTQLQWLQRSPSWQHCRSVSTLSGCFCNSQTKIVTLNVWQCEILFNQKHNSRSETWGRRSCSQVTPGKCPPPPTHTHAKGLNILLNGSVHSQLQTPQWCSSSNPFSSSAWGRRVYFVSLDEMRGAGGSAHATFGLLIPHDGTQGDN